MRINPAKFKTGAKHLDRLSTEALDIICMKLTGNDMNVHFGTNGNDRGYVIKAVRECAELMTKDTYLSNSWNPDREYLVDIMNGRDQNGRARMKTSLRTVIESEFKCTKEASYEAINAGLGHIQNSLPQKIQYEGRQ